MLRVIYNSTPLWDYFIDNCNRNDKTYFVKLEHKKNFWTSRKLFPKIVNWCLSRFLGLHYRYVIKGNLTKVSENDTILLLGIYNYADLVQLRKMYMRQRLILWLWNPVSNTYKRNASHIIGRLKNLGFDIYTFDANDARTYQLGVRPQFTMLPADCHTDGKASRYGVYFLGQPKGREEMLERIKQEYSALGIDCFFKIVHSPIDYISYEENIKNVIACKSVLEICQSGQKGMTLRTLEAMLCHRKLITNNHSIMEADFYNPHNIFVIGKDCNERIREFIESDFMIGDESILMKYEFNNWLDSFNHEQ